MFGTISLSATGAGRVGSRQELTLAPAGPFQVVDGRLVDARGRAFLIRGTELPEFRAATLAHHTRSGQDFGAYSATSLAAIRLRFNMNAVRLPVGPGADLRALEALVERANRAELLVLLAGGGADLARAFRANVNVMFEAPSAAGLAAIRTAGAAQVVIVGAAVRTGDGNVLRGVAPRFADMDTPARRQASLGAVRAPLLVRWDVDLDDPADCAALPADPAAAGALIEDSLRYFDRQQISWIVSRFEPQRLIWDLSLHHATTLDNGWTCGQPAWPPAGLGRIVQGHMRAADPRGLFVVGTAGGMEVARGGVAIAYGPVMASHDAAAPRTDPLPRTLAGLSVTVTDARGVTRRAGILWASAGWGQVNFVLPEETALGPALMTIARADGSRLDANFTVAATAPGFWTGVSCRGPAAGQALYQLADGSWKSAALSSCDQAGCRSLPVRLEDGVQTRLSLEASGFRFARPGEIQVTVGGVPVPLVSWAPSGVPGKDDVVVELPAALRGMGDVDLIARVRGRISNVVRVHLGG